MWPGFARFVGLKSVPVWVIGIPAWGIDHIQFNARLDRWGTINAIVTLFDYPVHHKGGSQRSNLPKKNFLKRILSIFNTHRERGNKVFFKNTYNSVYPKGSNSYTQGEHKISNHI